MPGKLCITVLLLVIIGCLSQEPPRPTFPDVFQTEIGGTFIDENGVVEIDATMYYDRTNNRAALFVTREAQITKQIYNFNTGESLSIDSNECEVEPIPEQPGFFPFIVTNGRKKLAEAEKAFFFTKSSKLESQTLTHDVFPTYKYKASNIKIEQYGQTNCTLTHVFSKPDVELPNCKEGMYCNSTLISITVVCVNKGGGTEVNHVYRFSKFVFEIPDDSIFLPPPGIHCDMKNTKEVPQFPSYFSFAFDIIERQRDTRENSVFKTHKEVWYDSEYKITRINEFDYNGILLSSRIFDLKAGVDFTIIATVPSCNVAPIEGNIKLDEVTRLPKSFFKKKEFLAKQAVYVGKRKVHGLNYDVWSSMWTDKDSDAKVVEEVYFLQIIPNREMSLTNVTMKSYYQISHVDMYLYEMSEDSEEYELVLLKYFSINNFRSKPKDWAAFDVSACFKNDQMKVFSLKVKAPPLVKGSQSYREALELLYIKIIAATGVSVIRISELRGIFDGVTLLEVRGSILDNSESVGWPKSIKEPGTEETFRLLMKAASENKLSVTFIGEDKKEVKIDVTSVEGIKGSEPKRPTFPDVFQTEIEGSFIDENGVVEIDATMYYDRTNNRAALFVTRGAQITKLIYNFNAGESLSIDSNACEVEPIPEEPGFFPFIVTNGRKKLAEAEKAFFFTESSKLESQTLTHDVFPTYKYKASNIKIEQYGQTNCTLTHVFSKPDVELPNCKEGMYCNSTLISITVECVNKDGGTEVNHVYRFSKFVFEIPDDSNFLPPPGIHCDMKNTKEVPPFPSYFSFAFDIIERQRDTRENSVFNTHKEVWYDSEYKITRINEFDYNGILLSSRIFDLKAGVAFTIIATVPSCDVAPIEGNIKLDEVTRLPKSFFYKNEFLAKQAVYVGKRKVHGLNYDVWSSMWPDKDSEAKIVEEVYFLQIIPNREMSSTNVVKKSYYQISHVDMYLYEMSEDSEEYELVLLKYFSINNFRSKPKDWAAFDVSACFKNDQMKVFSLKVKGPPLVKGSQSYREALELLYIKIIAATGVSVIRISELRGIFDGVTLLEVRGSILDNSESIGWPKNFTEPGTEETFRLLKKAAHENKLSVAFIGEDKKKVKVDVTSVEEIKGPAPPKSCFSGASLAAASLVLLLIGISFGVAGYYVFLKKRRSRSADNIHVKMSDLDPN